MSPHFIRDNLKLLATTPLNQICVDDECDFSLTTTLGISPHFLPEIIHRTFVAAKRAGPNFWVKLSEDDTSIQVCSAGHILNLIRESLPPEVQQLQLNSWVSTHNKATLTVHCKGGETVECTADAQLLRANSLMLREQLPSSEGLIAFEFTTESHAQNIKEAIAYFNGEGLPDYSKPSEFLPLLATAHHLKADQMAEEILAEIGQNIISAEDFISLSYFDRSDWVDKVLKSLTHNHTICLLTQLRRFTLKLTAESDYEPIVNERGITVGLKAKEGELSIRIDSLMVRCINEKGFKPSDFFGHKPESCDEFFTFIDAQLNSLERLEFPVSPENLEAQKRVPNLKHLQLFEQTSADNLKYIAHFPQLVSLDIAKVHGLNNEILSVLQSVAKLKHLTIAYTDLAYLEHLPELESLDLRACSDFSTDSLANLRHTPKLRRLYLPKCEQQGDIHPLSYLKYTSELRHLVAEGSSWMTSEAFNHLGNTPYLEELDIANSPNLRNLDRLSVVSQLKKLSVASCSALDAKSLLALRHTPQLISLDVSDCTQLEEYAMGSLLYTPEIENITVRGCTQLAPNFLQNLKQTSKLRTLNVSGLTQLAPYALSNLGFTPDLETLDISNCCQISPESFLFFYNFELRHLILDGCTQLKAHELTFCFPLMPELRSISMPSVLESTKSDLLRFEYVPKLERLVIPSSSLNQRRGMTRDAARVYFFDHHKVVTVETSSNVT